jgi:tetratricopeptide (TPR) repeat protein
MAFFRQITHGVLRSVGALVFLLMPQFSPAAERGFDAIAKTSRSIQAEWSEVFYLAPRAEQVTRYRGLLERIRALKAEAPQRAEPLIVEAIILCTYSAAALGLDTLEMLEESRDLLKKSIERDPKALEGAAYVTLGNLYRRLPGWPLLYGDKKIAREVLTTGVRLFPEGIDTNYFMGDILLEEGDTKAALPYLEKAARVPIRPTLRVSDEKLHKEAQEAVTLAQNGQTNRSEFFGQFTPSFR